jgi:hypothetical protein
LIIRLRLNTLQLAAGSFIIQGHLIKRFFRSDAHDAFFRSLLARYADLFNTPMLSIGKLVLMIIFLVTLKSNSILMTVAGLTVI